MWFNFHSQFSTYEKEVIKTNGTDITKEQLYSHLTIFEKTFKYDGIDYPYDTLASCITFSPQNEMPVGKKYIVT